MNSPEQIPLLDEVVAEELSPDRQKRRVAGARRGRTGLGARFLKAATFGILIPLFLAWGVYRIARWAVASERLVFQPDRDLVVTGNHYVTRDDLLTALGFSDSAVEPPFSIFRLNLVAEQKRVQSIPWIKSATIVRIFPDRLIVNVKERTPLAFAQVNGRLELVDEDGVFLPVPEKASFDFPVLSGLDSVTSPDQRKALLIPYSDFMNQTHDAVARSGWLISEANLSDPNDLRVLLVEGSETVLVHFGHQDFERRFKTFATLAPKVLATNPRIDSIDLRYRNEVVVDPFEAATAPGTGGQVSGKTAAKP